MFDFLKKLGGRMLENGAAYLRHAAVIEQILLSPSVEFAQNALRDYVFSLQDDADFQHFKAAIFQQFQLTQQSQMNAGGAWGNSTEDRIAYQQAHLIAGEPTGTMVAGQRLFYLQGMYQLAEQFWAEAQQIRAAPPAAPPIVPS